ncbi:MAG: hypothetical protein H6735_06035 [Alphaproteobacteria bacterium]|nr:hypothetical protein [Alphaproteobacteria bacterium]
MTPDTSDPPALHAEAPPEASSPDDLLHLARERARHGDWEGARILAQDAAEVPGEHQVVARYLTALCLEFEGRLPEALAAYDALMVDAPSDDTRFRRAECLGKMGRVTEARDQLDDIARVRALSEADQIKVNVLLAIWDLELGKERKALKQLDRVLDGAGEEAGYYQAMARNVLLHHALDQADDLAFDGSDRAKAKALERRAGLIALSEDQLAKTITLGEVGYALDGFLRLGRSYEDLGVDLLAESPVRGLTEAQLAINRDLLEDRVEKVWVKGTLFYDRAVQLAARENWTGAPLADIHTSWERLEARVDGLSATDQESP